MERNRLKVYVGPIARCNNCGHEFSRGEVVTVADGGSLVFCGADHSRECLYNYTARKEQSAAAHFSCAMVYQPRRRWYEFWR